LNISEKWKMTAWNGPTCDGVNSIPISFVYHEDNSFSVSHERITTLIDYFKSLETSSTLPTIKLPYSNPILSLYTVQSESDGRTLY
jgi:hypothetical protein